MTSYCEGLVQAFKILERSLQNFKQIFIKCFLDYSTANGSEFWENLEIFHGYFWTVSSFLTLPYMTVFIPCLEDFTLWIRLFDVHIVIYLLKLFTNYYILTRKHLFRVFYKIWSFKNCKSWRNASSVLYAQWWLWYLHIIRCCMSPKVLENQWILTVYIRILFRKKIRTTEFTFQEKFLMLPMKFSNDFLGEASKKYYTRS